MPYNPIIISLKKNTFLLLFLAISVSGIAQDENAWFYLRAKDSLFQPEFRSENDSLIYIGQDLQLKKILDKYKIATFKKTYKKAKKVNLKKTFFVISEEEEMLEDLLTNATHLFEFGELIASEDKKIFEPNDYGLTSTIGENLGLQVNLDYYDFLELPKAWYYTTGSPAVILGIADGQIDTTDLDFKGKTKTLRKTRYSNGHGISVASLAAAQGDNSHGVPGVCYDCGIYSTSYGDFRNLAQLIELSEKGAKVINCSWISGTHYETAQAVIDELYANGTIIVGAAGNNNWKETKQGTKLYYPASYNHVISVSSVNYKHETVADNTLKIDTLYYADNIKHYIGRTMGFKHNDPSKPHTIYPVSVTAINDEVDILAPSAGLFRYAKYLKGDNKIYIEVEATSPAAPLVTGAVGLMFSLDPCLPHDEVESILKFTSTNIDYIEVNKPYRGKYGSGALNIGKAVKMVYDLATPESTVIIENQSFSRWDFKLTSHSREVIIKNQKFTEGATLSLSAKKRIVISENTLLKPNSNGRISLKIEPTLQKECELQLRDPRIVK